MGALSLDTGFNNLVRALGDSTTTCSNVLGNWEKVLTNTKQSRNREISTKNIEKSGHKAQRMRIVRELYT